MYRIGFSKDKHNLVKGNGISIGGINIECDRSPDAYSDGDVLFHALAESIYGALGMEDIGTYYNKKNKEKKFKSSCMIKDVNAILISKQFKIVNIDILIELDKPNLTKYKDIIKDNVAMMLGLSKEVIAIKATTTEGNHPNLVTCYSNVLIKKEENY
ncbi:2-C-methyl-D-erythritol 2,4-cyclodiphosphate synthase [Spiroplasma corruscae]|uniref:2-C-methyl-D-erythritol 2,4-cyclodiphosphate synthase n=1 Tax=Spiroplasma corruscae TaxID=216934 RepID=A0A222ERB4_9MOLU|nr:2-C-methyl-D-erythritol 2,4-cyclodiphosphate synthase [Spiroplasma corruscae]ASP28744.1 2-C-methyl-D-erythritol 2,4-cyclodiphosphate synthase [Spiroplasma corruscae]